jgi:hypothetical protein
MYIIQIIIWYDYLYSNNENQEHPGFKWPDFYQALNGLCFKC